MANDLNQCNFTGRLGANPDARFTAQGTAVTTFRIACGESFTDAQGQKQERTEWITIVTWKKLAELASQYLAKGSFVRITGKFTTRKWTDRDGNDRYSSEIVAREMQFLSSANSGQQGGQNNGQSSGQYQQQTQSQQGAQAGQGYGQNQGQQQGYGGGGSFDEPTFNPDDEIPF